MNKYLEILQHNQGFDDPTIWLKYAQDHDFKKVKATKLAACPDCNSFKSKKLGQYVYYSNLMRMMSCQSCGLIYSDTKLNRGLLNKHFDVAYKDEQYFATKRRRIFFQIAKLIKKNAPCGGKVMDIGGAQGHLLKIVKDLRPDLNVTLNDLSIRACNYAKNNFGFKTVPSCLENLQCEEKAYDLILLIDVLYYETALNRAWETISSLARDSIIIRIPNKLWLINLILLMRKTFLGGAQLERADRIHFLNPEHSFIFPNKYMKNRLRSLNFTKIKVMPSASLVPNKRLNLLLQVLFFWLIKMIYFISAGKIVLSPSKIIWAKKI